MQNNIIFKEICLYFYHSDVNLYYILTIYKVISSNVFYFFPHPVILIPPVISIYLRKRKLEVVPPVFTNYSVSPGYFVRMPVIYLSSSYPYLFLRTGNNLNSNIFTTGNAISCGAPEEGVGLGVFGLGFLFFSFPFLVGGCASEKYAQLAYTIGKLS